MAAISDAISRAALTTESASGSTSFTRPIWWARSALTSLPVKASSAAWPLGTIRGRRWSVPTSATIAMRVSRTENTASAAASRMSHAVIRSIPPPRQYPCTAAITGLGQSATELIEACMRRTLR